MRGIIVTSAATAAACCCLAAAAAAAGSSGSSGMFGIAGGRRNLASSFAGLDARGGAVGERVIFRYKSPPAARRLSSASRNFDYFDGDFGLFSLGLFALFFFLFHLNDNEREREREREREGGRELIYLVAKIWEVNGYEVPSH